MIHKLLTDPTVEHVRALTAWCAALSIALVISLGLASWNVVRAASDQHAICKIQQAWLPAGHEIASALADVQKLTADPLTPAGPIEQDLVANIGKYEASEAHVPASLTC